MRCNSQSKIGIIDADLIANTKHRFPNLACMKLSAYSKEHGSNVDLLTSYDDIYKYDGVYISKVFTDTPVPEGIIELPNVQHGGTGFFYDKAKPLDYEIEHIMPDYHLYDEFVQSMISSGVRSNGLQYYTDFSIGFTTRGCIRGCSFCVNKNYKSCIQHSPVSEFVSSERKYICCLDDNVLACKDWRKIFDKLNATGKKFQFKQGLDERLLTDEKCDVLFNSNWIGDYIFAFDNINDRVVIEDKLKLIRNHTNRVPKFYCFCGYNHQTPNQYSSEFWAQDISDLFERIRILMQYKCLPYIMRYKDYALSPYAGMYITIARWCNQPNFVKKKSFREFCYANGNNSSAVRYMLRFESEHRDIADTYYDMKW